ncbi:WD repeat-containing protein 60 [Portunus trituberculatus]|uniref:WD repeat-containing protein 60 n=1 Tax=Portunus trituberculatus TaxID=210409 RepID=A0A5B7G215_PORTR|nr:WD repeat-containing protein 60 [Portunus trituberculatus]
MLAILEEELLWDLAESSSTDSSSSMEGLGFSHPPVPLGSSVKPLLQGRLIPFVQFCAAEPTLLLSGHGYQHLEEEEEDAMGLNEGGLVCLWSVQEPSRPQQLLCCRASPVAATFSPSKPSLVLAGLEDGSLAAWDLREHFKFHSLKIKIDDVNWRVRVPSFITGNTL